MVINGGTAAGDDLTLNSTSNATKGYVLLQSAGGNVGIGTATPSELLEVNGGNVEIQASSFPTLRLVAGDASNGWIQFHQTTSETREAYISYNHSSNTLYLGNAGGGTQYETTFNGSGNWSFPVQVTIADKLTLNLTGNSLDVGGFARFGNGTANVLVGNPPAWAGNATFAGIWHSGHTADAGGYGLLMSSSNTYINAPTAGTVYLRINNSDVMSYNSTVLTLSGDLTMNGANGSNVMHDCNWEVDTATATSNAATCAAGYYTMSGGCLLPSGATLYGSRPFGPPADLDPPTASAGWYCFANSSVSITAYALCCRY